MPEHTPLLATVVTGLVLAFLLGAAVNRFRVSPLVGYLLAGIVIGPFTPGYTADQGMAHDLAEIGIILLMFGVGLHFTLKDLLSVRGIAVPGALIQIACATMLGIGLGRLLGWPFGGSLLFGLALSVASTVVLLRAMQERRLVETERGRIAVGWLVVEDLAMVLTLVLLPGIAGILKGETTSSPAVMAMSLLLTVAKVAAFVALMLIFGKRLIPAMLHWVAHTGSRELFRLAVLAMALGVAFAASHLFDVSFALGAFFAGMILSESELSQRAGEETLPLRDAFSVLFFVSAGMLVDPGIILRDPLALLATLLIILVGKSAAAYLIVRLFGHPVPHALTIAASLAQIGEFSFILVGLGMSLSLLPERGRDLILASAIISILVNPLIFEAVARYLAWRGPVPSDARGYDEDAAHERATREPIPVTQLTDHVVLVGFGRVGRAVSGGLRARRTPMLVIEESTPAAEAAQETGLEVIRGSATDRDVIDAADLPAARCLIVAIPNAFESGQVVARARAINPSLHIIARSHSDAETEHLLKRGADRVVMGEQEIASVMLGDLTPDAA